MYYYMIEENVRENCFTVHILTHTFLSELMGAAMLLSSNDVTARHSPLLFISMRMEAVLLGNA